MNRHGLPIVLALAAFGACQVLAVSFTPGNLLVVHDDTLYEFTPAGVEVQSTAIPTAGGTESARGVDFDLVGSAQVFNGTFTPQLSTYEPVGDAWTDHTMVGWSTANNVSYGGVAIFQEWIFATDMATAGAGSPQGLVRFDSSNSFSATRFATSEQYTDVSVGLDGILYALRDDRILDKFNPGTMASQGTVTLGSVGLDVRGIAVNASGAIFAASWDDNIYHFDATGVQQNSIASGETDLIDIDVNGSGLIVVGTRFDAVVQTTEARAAVSSFSIASSFESTFVAWVEDPLPVELLEYSIE